MIMSCINSTATESTSDDLNHTDHAALVLRQFRIVFSAVRTHFQQVEKQVGIGGAQVWALSVINTYPGIGITGLARAMDIHQSTGSNLIRQLRKQKLVRIEKSTSDKRSVHLFIESCGLALLRKAPGPAEGVLPLALQHLPRQTLIQLQGNLGELLTALRTDEKAAGIPLAQL